MSLSKWKEKLRALERAIPPISRSARPEKIDGRTASDLRYLSPRRVGRLLDGQEDDIDNFNIVSLGDEPDNMSDDDDFVPDQYFCDAEVQRSLKEFHESLRDIWPISCQGHKAMLRLAYYRRTRQREGEELVLDTLSSGHDDHWGRILFSSRTSAPSQINRRRIRFEAGVTTGSQDHGTSASKQPFESADLDPSLKPSDANETGRLLPSTLCSLIGKSVQDAVCLNVDVGSLEAFEPRGQIGFNCAHRAPLNILLGPAVAMSETKPSTGSIPMLSLSQKQKAEVGLLLACTLLQLCKGGWGTSSEDGPWLLRDWMRDSIQFVPPIESSEFDCKWLYLPVNLNKDVLGGVAAGFFNSSVVALATLLVQLQDEEVVEKFKSLRQSLLATNHPEHRINYCALLCLIDQSEFTTFVDKRCQKAIRQCVKDGFAHVVGTEADEAKVSRLFHAKVIKPLSEYCQQFVVPSVPAADNGYIPQSVHRRGSPHVKGRRDGAKREFSTPSSLVAESDEKWLGNLKKISGRILQSRVRFRKHLERPIRIAILDTGLDKSMAFFQAPARKAMIKGIVDFVSTKGNDTFGHGSLMAQLIMEAAPLAEIYVARVAHDTTSLPERKMELAKAIKWAQDQEADIVSMSFGLADTDTNISEAIQNAHLKRKNGIIFLASAGNSPEEREKFPACHPSVISIRATNARGEFLACPPLLSTPGYAFATYGDIPSRILDEYNDAIGQPGSSVATAIAAGIAAIMLAYIDTLPLIALESVDQKKIKEELKRRRKELLALQKFRTTEGMSQLFERMAPEKDHPKKRWVCPVWFWDERATDQERERALLEVASGVHTPAPVTRSFWGNLKG
ncbi:hypothetical protein QBC47DRAFT_455801 [Echria macrotheca]|uniref:Peptidase S8/S53 domain-containing protein n=1 Tax=Echria macrotheca TaxID=438768 RepID=A0AAJ0F0X3_9PEZI|nr:hypothetical protein QBC47DRAFT_455801 [Echria macrotheca]